MAAPLNTNAGAHKIVTEEHVKGALLKDKGPDAKFKAFEIIDFCSKGDNYACFVTSVKVTFILGGEEKTVTYIAKLNPGVQMELMEYFTKTAFEKEGKFYSVLIPALNDFLQSVSLPQLKFASCYRFSLESKKEIILLEDKRNLSFKMADRMVGLDDDHVILVVKELARLHATSALLEEQMGSEDFLKKFDILEDAFTSDEAVEKSGAFKDAFSGYLQTGAKIADQLKGYDGVSAALTAKAPAAFARMKEVIEDIDPKFLVVNHGDCWNNNLLFRYEEGKVVDVCLLDLQICRHASLALDLNYFFFTSLNGDTRKNGLQSYLAAYYNSFKEVFDAAKKPMKFTLEELGKEYINKLEFGLYMALMVMPIVVMQSTDAPEFSDVTDDNMEQKMAEFQQKVIDMIDTSPLLRPRLLDMFDEMVEHGVLKTS